MRVPEIHYELKSMPLEELWKLREEVIVRLGNKLVAEKAMLEERLHQLRLDNAASFRLRPLEGGRQADDRDSARSAL